MKGIASLEASQDMSLDEELDLTEVASPRSLEKRGALKHAVAFAFLVVGVIGSVLFFPVFTLVMVIVLLIDMLTGAVF